MAKKASPSHQPPALEKVPSGIRGLDEITFGGLPRHRTALVCGGPGAGKTLMATEFLVRGATEHGEPGVFIAFEETPAELARNVGSLGFDLDDLQRRRLLAIDHVRIERHEVEVTGEYDLEALFIRIGYLVDRIGAKRIVLDTLESLFSSLPNEAILRAELRRLFGWLKEKKLTAIITAERGEKSVTRYGLEEYVSDCVILLDHRVEDEIATRRLRILKYRGSLHGTNEYPFLIDEQGFSVLPITSISLNYEVPTDRVGTGVAQLDDLMHGGYLRGSTILISGSAGTGKSTLCASFVDDLCRQGGRAIYFAMEESPHQILRNMRSIGLDLRRWVEAGLLRFLATRPTTYGLEMHLLSLHRRVEEFDPAGIVMDPISNLLAVGQPARARSMLMRMIDYLKTRQVTAVFTNLTAEESAQTTQAGVSSLMDTWLVLHNQEVDGERNRLLYILKSRGTPHSNRVAEFKITPSGLSLAAPYVGPGQVLTGSARSKQEARDRAEALTRRQRLGARQREIERRRRELESEIQRLRSDFAMQEEELNLLVSEQEAEERQSQEDRAELGRLAARGSRQEKDAAGRGGNRKRGRKAP